MRLMRIFAPLFCVLALGCSKNHNFSGRWQLVEGCENLDDCGGYVYELNLGRYGKSLTGLVVRYINRGYGNSFERTSECGCFFIQAGRATEEFLRFQLYRPDLPGPPEGADTATACDPIPGECENRIFKLYPGEDENLLDGILSCGEDDPSPAHVKFEYVVGETRTTCALPNEVITQDTEIISDLENIDASEQDAE